MSLLITQATKEEITEFLKEVKGLTKEEAKKKFLTISEKELELVKDEKFIFLSNLVYLFVYYGGDIDKDVGALIVDINNFINNQTPEEDVLDKLILKRRKVIECYMKERKRKFIVSNFDSYGLSA